MAAVHDGYTRIKSKPLHKRNWKLDDSSIEIIDEVSGSGNSVQLRYYLHPDIHVHKHEDSVILSISSEKLAKIRTEQNMQVVDSIYHDKFGISRKNKCLFITGVTPFTCMIKINWTL